MTQQQMIVEMISNRPFYKILKYAAEGLGDGWQKQRIRQCYVEVLNESIKVECGREPNKDRLWHAQHTIRDLSEKRLAAWRRQALKEAMICLGDGIAVTS